MRLRSISLSEPEMTSDQAPYRRPTASEATDDSVLSRGSHPIPLIDIFAGPGGLSEGFASLTSQVGAPIFDVRLSIEKDVVAHRTLELRALFRKLGMRKAPDSIYDYFRGYISREELFAGASIRNAVADVREEVRCATLGEERAAVVDRWISRALGAEDKWVLVGGPPCQAYSLVGRSRRANEDRQSFESDGRHVLYKEYLRILRRFHPAVFVMENVKGILSSRLKGRLVFDQILRDLTEEHQGVRYHIRSFVRPERECGSPLDLLIAAEKFGIPQARHRVVILGVREEFAWRYHQVLQEHPRLTTVWDAIGDLPPLRSRISREKDCYANWLSALTDAPNRLLHWDFLFRDVAVEGMKAALAGAGKHNSIGERFTEWTTTPMTGCSELTSWLHDSRLGGICSHESRRHMRSDLQRYLFAAAFTREFGFSPKLDEYPGDLLPDHGNVGRAVVPFGDRFKVQVADEPSSTIVSHIAKDGHYFIHPDPSQARSLTVREAARLQTFPDNYLFEGNRTEQYVQVGNAVPPLLAQQLARTVLSLLEPPSGTAGR